LVKLSFVSFVSPHLKILLQAMNESIKEFRQISSPTNSNQSQSSDAVAEELSKAIRYQDGTIQKISRSYTTERIPINTIDNAIERVILGYKIDFFC